MIHPSSKLKFINEVIGNGVVATAHIPKGTIVWALDSFDLRVSPEEVKARGPHVEAYFDSYAYTYWDGSWVMCWDHARFLNHSNTPNVISTPFDFDLAVTDIAPGEEITIDYGQLLVTEEFGKSFTNAQCEARSSVSADDPLRHAKTWDELLAQAYVKMKLVEQPLATLLSAETWKKVSDIVDGKIQFPSTSLVYESFRQGTKLF